MLEVKVPSEIRDCKGKMVAGLNTRQLVGVAGALITGIPIGVAGKGHIPGDILPWIVIASAAPFIAFGFIKFKGMYFEEFARVLSDYFILPQQRVYEDENDNIFCAIREELISEDIRRQRILLGDYDEEDEYE